MPFGQRAARLTSHKGQRSRVHPATSSLVTEYRARNLMHHCPIRSGPRSNKGCQLRLARGLGDDHAWATAPPRRASFIDSSRDAHGALWTRARPSAVASNRGPRTCRTCCEQRPCGAAIGEHRAAHSLYGRKKKSNQSVSPGRTSSRQFNFSPEVRRYSDDH
jgi:hypothetical protein